MPSLSPTMTEGSIIKWHKKEGNDLSFLKQVIVYRNLKPENMLF